MWKFSVCREALTIQTLHVSHVSIVLALTDTDHFSYFSLQSRAAVLVLILWLLLFPTPSHLWRRRRRRRIKRLAVEEGEAEYCSTSDRTSSSSNPQPVPCPIADEALLVIIVATTVAIISACITFLSIKFYRIRRSTHLRFADRGRGVVIAVARESGSTSIVYCRDIDNSGDGDGRPFQLYKFENRTFWTNEELTNERIKVGSLLNYQRDVSPYQILCKLGSLDRKQFVGNAGGKPQVSFHDVNCNFKRRTPRLGLSKSCWQIFKQLIITVACTCYTKLMKQWIWVHIYVITTLPKLLLRILG